MLDDTEEKEENFQLRGSKGTFGDFQRGRHLSVSWSCFAMSQKPIQGLFLLLFTSNSLIWVLLNESKRERERETGKEKEKTIKR